MFVYDVAVIGIGRVGLPLALIFADKGLKVLGIDRDREIIESINERKMPFTERGCQEILDGGCLIDTSYSLVDAQKAEKIIITVGTPFTEHIEMNLEHINEVLNAIIPVLRKKPDNRITEHRCCWHYGIRKKKDRIGKELDSRSRVLSFICP